MHSLLRSSLLIAATISSCFAAVPPAAAEPEQTSWRAGFARSTITPEYPMWMVPSLRVLQEGGYEAGGAMRYTTLPGPFAPSVEQQIVESVHRLAERVQADP